MLRLILTLFALAHSLGGCSDAPTSFHAVGDSDAEPPSLRNDAMVPPAALPKTPITPQRWQFAASETAPMSLTLNLETAELTQELVLSASVVPRQLALQQVIRPIREESFSLQGSTIQRTEAFVQASMPHGPLDILVVIDNSGSMQEEQANLSSRILPLLSMVQDTDWQIGIVTTDPKDGCLSALIRKGEAATAARFARAIQAGTQGSGNEQGILQAVRALDPSCSAAGAPWLRKDATLGIIFVSDEDNCSSSGTDCRNDPWSRPEYLLSTLSGRWQPGLTAKVYGLIWHPSESSASCSTAENQAPVYAAAIAATAGRFGSICAEDFGPILRNISYDLNLSLQKQFTLQDTPAPGSLRVYANGQLQASGFQLHGRIVEFAQAPNAATKIEIRYQIAVPSAQNEWILASSADPSSLKVYIDAQPIQTYQYEPELRRLRLEQPSQGKNLLVQYRAAGALGKSFKLDSTAHAEGLRAYANNNEVAIRDFAAASGIVTLTTAPTDGSQLRFSWQDLGEARLRYPHFADASVVHAIQATSSEGDRILPIGIRVEGNELILQATDFRPGRIVRLRYPSPYLRSKSIDLGRDIIAESVQISACSQGQALVQERQISLQGCELTQQKLVTISFAYILAHHLSFPLGAESLTPGTYELRVNSELWPRFSVTANTLSVADLPFGAHLDLALYPNSID